jgi:hypothetical protein
MKCLQKSSSTPGGLLPIELDRRRGHSWGQAVGMREDEYMATTQQTYLV